MLELLKRLFRRVSRILTERREPIQTESGSALIRE